MSPANPTPEGLEDFDALLAAASGENGEPDLEALFAGVEGEIPEGAFDALMAGEDFESLLRDEWALPTLDVTKELSRADALHRDGKGAGDDLFASDEYTDEQWPLVLALKKPCLEATATDVAPKRREEAIRWIFEEGARDRHGLSFDQACRALGARGFVVQALIQHFWYLRGVVLDEGLPYLSRPLSEVLESEAIMAGMDAGLRLAHVAWRFPSIEEPALFARCNPDNVASVHNENLKAMEWLCESGLLARRFGRVYFTSRHPERRHRPNALQGKVRGVSWSQSFVGDTDE